MFEWIGEVCEALVYAREKRVRKERRCLAGKGKIRIGEDFVYQFDEFSHDGDQRDFACFAPG